MASNGIDGAEAQWRAQFEAMKAALSSLNLPADAKPTDLDFDDDYEGYSSGNAAQDVWDFISDDDDDYSSDQLDGPDGFAQAEEFGADWFVGKCSEVAAKNGLSSDAFQNQVLGVLTLDSGEDEVQSQLTDLIGFDDLEFIIELLAHRSSIVTAVTSQGTQEGPGGRRLLSKAERDEALRRKDYEHKTAVLAPHVNRENEYPHVYKAHSANNSLSHSGRKKDYEHKTAVLAPHVNRENEYPHVYKAHSANNSLSHSGRKYALPEGSKRDIFEKYEEYSIPAGKKGTLGPGRKLVNIADMDGLCRATFKGYKSLNRMQSLVHPVAYKTNENMLICAPTGAGKTDAAMLTILQTIGHYCTPNPIEDPSVTDFAVNSADFKIVYVAPMKALAAEITDKLGKRLAWLGIKCREYTGDMHLTKSEIVQTQIIVTTPEKWDVVTRKGTGDTELVQKVRLLIIDEVHMLHDERGAVLESLVARTERQVESTQSLIRIVGQPLHGFVLFRRVISPRSA
ncbi:putative helicase mug81 like protein [Verticillium longisporum]|nr:putative helicase mug81 like protein [Verticillium longisporum]